MVVMFRSGFFLCVCTFTPFFHAAQDISVHSYLQLAGLAVTAKVKLWPVRPKVHVTVLHYGYVNYSQLWTHINQYLIAYMGLSEAWMEIAYCQLQDRNWDK